MRPAQSWLRILASLVIALGGTSFGQASRTYVEFEPISPVLVRPGHQLPVRFTFHIQDGWHINSDQPLTQELIPTHLGFTSPAGIVIGRTQYPPGRLTSFPFDPSEKLSVYSGDVVITSILTAHASVAPGRYTVHGDLKYQPCDNNACYPPKKLPVQFDVTVSKVGSQHVGGTKRRSKR